MLRDRIDAVQPSAKAFAWKARSPKSSQRLRLVDDGRGERLEDDGAVVADSRDPAEERVEVHGARTQVTPEALADVRIAESIVDYRGGTR